jgi:hypothetical protein
MEAAITTGRIMRRSAAMGDEVKRDENPNEGIQWKTYKCGIICNPKHVYCDNTETPWVCYGGVKPVEADVPPVVDSVAPCEYRQIGGDDRIRNGNTDRLLGRGDVEQPER